jgi:hypothetical protein
MNEFWDWVYARQAEYHIAGDRERARLPLYWGQAFEFRETDPAHAEAILREGWHLAQSLGEPWWTMVLLHWRLQSLMHWLKDYREVVELAVRNSVAASKPENAAFPARWYVYLDLATAYRGVDPEGYAAPIREALAYLERDIPDVPLSERYLMLENLRGFHLECGDIAAAESVATWMQELADRDTDRHRVAHYLTCNYSDLCAIAVRQEDWNKLADAATEGENAARTAGLQMELCEFLTWQAVLARRAGDEPRARRLHATAAAKIAGLRMPPQREYPDAVALFHELGGELDKALPVRDRELAVLADHGRFAYECEAHLKRAALRAKMGLLRREDLDAARQVACKLRKPERALTEIERLLAALRP